MDIDIYLIVTLRGHSILTVFDAIVVKVVILVFDRHFRSENVNILQVFDRVFPDDGRSQDTPRK